MRARLRRGVRGRALRADRVARRRLPASSRSATSSADRDWFDGLWESNCLFVPRKLLEQVGGFDEGFAMAGGGYTNLDLYERLAVDARRPGRHDPRRGLVPPGPRRHDHQPEPTPPKRRERVFGYYAEHYAELRGRPFIGPARSRSTSSAASRPTRRSGRARARMTARTFAVDPADRRRRRPGQAARRCPTSSATASSTPTGAAARPDRTDVARPDRSRTRRPTCSPTRRSSTEVRPDWIIETGTRDGGRALFLASICDLLGHGQVALGRHRRGPEPARAPAHHLHRRPVDRRRRSPRCAPSSATTARAS